jgi:CheY-like chemotaxis protein
LQASDVRREKHIAINLVQRHASWNSTNPRVTIVEADIALAIALSHNLKTEGYVVESVDRGEEALRKLADAPPDLVILDWMPPGISGPEICIRLRGEDATRMVPIIMLSARGEEVLRLRGFSAGADDFVVKPFVVYCDAAGPLPRTTCLLEAIFNSIAKLEESAGACARSISDQRNSGCSNVCSSGLAASFLGSTFWSAFGAHASTSPIERSMST